jgi:hypothetical protein
MENAYVSYTKVMAVITHPDNKFYHMQAISRLVRNFKIKFPEESTLINSLSNFEFDVLKTILNNKHGHQ